MTKITFKSYIEWEDYARDYCEQTIERIFEMPEQEEIDNIVNDVFYRGFADEYNLSAMDVEITNEMKAEAERGVRAYITEQIEENVVPAPVFETICDALDDSEHNTWSESYLKEDKRYTKTDLCQMLRDWLYDNDIP
jgi:hypothetical protein